MLNLLFIFYICPRILRLVSLIFHIVIPDYLQLVCSALTRKIKSDKDHDTRLLHRLSGKR
jgi:hypothetical protein